MKIFLAFLVLLTGSENIFLLIVIWYIMSNDIYER